MIIAYLAAHGRADVHYVREALYRMQAFYLDRAELAYLAKVVAAQIYQHVMFGQLLFVGQQFDLKRLILRVSLAARPRTRQREGVQHAIFKLNQRFGRCTRHLNISAGEVEHVRRRVDRAQYAVRVEQTSFKRRGQAVGQHYLEYIAFADIVLGLFDHAAELLLIKQRRDLAQQPAARLVLLFAVVQQVGYLFKLPYGLVVIGLGIA